MKVQPLGRLFLAAAFSAATAAVAAQPAAVFLKPYIASVPLSARLAGYAAVFAASFTLLSFAAGHISFSLKTRGLEKAKGLSPALARLVLIAAVFTVPLLFAAAPAVKKTASLKTLMAESEKRAAAEKEQGYDTSARAKLGALLGGK